MYILCSSDVKKDFYHYKQDKEIIPFEKLFQLNQ